MDKFKIRVNEIYEYEMEVYAESGDDAIKKAKELYSQSRDGNFIADASSFKKSDFSIKNREIRPSVIETAIDLANAAGIDLNSIRFK